MSFLVMSFLLVVTDDQGIETLQPKNELPAPIPLVEMGPMGPVRPGYFLPDRYAAWSLYAIDRQGMLKPRVVFAPQPFYAYNGQPYNYLPTRPLDMSNVPGPR